MTLDLTSVRAKLTRSQEHTQTFKNEFMAWSERHPYSLVKKRNADCTRHSLIIHVNEPPPLERWSLVIADAFNNLRNALDHLVFAVAMAESGQTPPPFADKLQFPICDMPDKFANAISGKQLGTISDPIRAHIERAQPYNRPHEILPPLLSILRDFTNSDKHKLLHVALATITQGDIGFTGYMPPGGECMADPFMGEVKDNTEIFAMVCNRPAPEMDFDRHIVDITVAIKHAKRDARQADWTSRTEFTALYRDMSSFVRGLIYEVAEKVQ